MKKEGKKKKFGFSSIFKMAFSILFLIITILWTLYVISFIGLHNAGWDWVSQWPGVSQINDMLNSFVNKNSHSHKMAGLYSLFIGIDIVLLYTALFYPIQKIPLIGKILRWLTGIVPALGVVLAIIGSILIWVL